MAGLPVIASDYEGMGSFVVDQGFGVTCDPTSITEIAASIRNLQTDPDLRIRLAKNAQAASAKFNWQIEQEKLLAVYSNLKE